jgi:hypothetical protein
MTASDLFLAAMLLSAPAGTPEQLPQPDRWPAIQAALQKTALDWEILDPRETRYILAKAEDFQEDLDFLRRRRTDLADAPKIWESDRLPDRRIVSDYIQFNRAYHTYLETRMAWEADRACLIYEALTETEQMYKLWDAIREAKGDCHYITVRRLALKRLRDGVGQAAYDAGELPPYVPEWRFTVIK